jgi:hypothetical protein
MFAATGGYLSYGTVTVVEFDGALSTPLLSTLFTTY